MVEGQSLASEPDWITQMLEQVQKVGLWNEPIPEEPSRGTELPQVAVGISRGRTQTSANGSKSCCLAPCLLCSRNT